MSVELMILTNHLDKIQSGRPHNLMIDLSTNNKTAEFASVKMATALICIGKGLIKLAETIIKAP